MPSNIREYNNHTINLNTSDGSETYLFKSTRPGVVDVEIPYLVLNDFLRKLLKADNGRFIKIYELIDNDDYVMYNVVEYDIETIGGFTLKHKDNEYFLSIRYVKNLSIQTYCHKVAFIDYNSFMELIDNVIKQQFDFKRLL